MPKAARRNSPTNKVANQDVELGVLRDQVGFALRLAQVAVLKDLNTALQPYDLRPVDLSVLRLIDINPGTNQKKLAEALRLQSPNLVTVIDQLQQRNLLQRTAVPENRRSKTLSLTAAGRKLLSQGEAVDALHLHRIRTAIGESETSVLLSLLNRLAQLNDAPIRPGAKSARLTKPG